MKIKGTLLFSLAACAMLMLPPLTSAQTCSGNGDFVGAYGFSGARTLWVPETLPPPGTTETQMPPTPVDFSDTGLGRLLEGATGLSPFSTAGRFTADGAGTLFATSADNIMAKVGDYQVNTDCTLTATLTDAFLAPSTTNEPSTPASITWEGILRAGGSEVVLVQTEPGTGTSIVLHRTASPIGCTNATISGTYLLSGFVADSTTAEDNGNDGDDNGNDGDDNGNGNGNDGDDDDDDSGTPNPNEPNPNPEEPNPNPDQPQPTDMVRPIPLIGRVVADGNGHFISDSTGSSSPLPQRQITGTYEVKSDCTGSGTLITKTGEKDDMGNEMTRTWNIDFVVVQDGQACQTGTSPGGSRPEIQFVFTGEKTTGSGVLR